jgi:hypothetical protein
MSSVKDREMYRKSTGLNKTGGARGRKGRKDEMKRREMNPRANANQRNK